MKNQVEPPLPEAAKRLLAYWESAQRGDRPPPRSAVDPIKLREWIGDISVIQYIEGEKNLYIRLHGLNVAQKIGDYYARGYLEDMIPASAHSVVFEAYYVARKTLRPVHSIITPGVLKGSFEKFERFVLPFVDDETAQLERFVVWVGPTNRDVLECETIYAEPAAGVKNITNAEGESRLTVL